MRNLLLIAFGAVCLVLAVVLSWAPACNKTDPAKFIGGTIPGPDECP